MSRYYGTLKGNRGLATRQGTSDSGLKVSAQSWNGSLITYIHDGPNDQEPIFDLMVSTGSELVGHTIFSGTLNELIKKLGR